MQSNGKKDIARKSIICTLLINARGCFVPGPKEKYDKNNKEVKARHIYLACCGLLAPSQTLSSSAAQPNSGPLNAAPTPVGHITRWAFVVATVLWFYPCCR